MDTTIKPKRPKTGGRKAGTPNKCSGPARLLYSGFVEEYFPKYIDAMKRLYSEDPAAFVRAFNDAVKKVLPDLQSTKVEVIGDKASSLVDKLNSLADDASKQTS